MRFTKKWFAGLFLVRPSARHRRAFLVFTVVASIAVGLATVAGTNNKEEYREKFLEVGGSTENLSETGPPLMTMGGIAFVAPNSLSGFVPPEDISRGSQVGLLTYIVKEGDTLSTIAAEYGVSTNTILWENNLSIRSLLKPGMKLSILPVDGVKHVVERGDTVSGIATSYKADMETILAYNILEEDEILKIGDIIIIPDASPISSATNNQPSATSSSAPTRSLIDASGYFIMPVHGRRTQGLHRYNAVDLGGSNYCGTPVLASAPGTVSAARGGWNGGYGNYVKITHPNGTVTLYAHNAKNLVVTGQSVEQGEPIAYMGSTGNSTGCHVHFEVRGALNPFSS